MKYENEVYDFVNSFDLLSKSFLAEWEKKFNRLSIKCILVLSELNEKGPLMVSTLAKLLHITPAAVTGISNHLFKGNYITRSRDTNDRRVLFLDITEEGKNILSEAAEISTYFRERMYELLSEDEVKNLQNITKKLISNPIKVDK